MDNEHHCKMSSMCMSTNEFACECLLDRERQGVGAWRAGAFRKSNHADERSGQAVRAECEVRANRQMDGAGAWLPAHRI